MYSKTKDLLRFAKEAKAQLAHSRAFVRHMIEIVDTNKPTELDSILANIESARQYIDSVITEIGKTGAMPATFLMEFGDLLNIDTTTSIDEICDDLIDGAFKTYDKVLVRNSSNDAWVPRFFAMRSIHPNKYGTTDGVFWRHCISFEGHEHLIGTTNEIWQ